ncbi:MAG: PKD domain-containing protein [Flavobacteriales bacterium]|nr:PKD domain-containing protein [Flavobacteriales bacterium]
MKRILIYTFCLLGFLSVEEASNAQSFSNKGTEFWLGFMAHSNSQAGMYLYITSDSSTTGSVSIPGRSWSTTFSVTANQMTLVQVPTSQAFVNCSDCITDQGIKVVSGKPIVVYAHIYYQYRSDATLVLPNQTCGKEYYCVAYEQGITSDRTQFMIVAHKDNTKINITPSVDLRSKTGSRMSANSTYTITLDEGQVYQGRAFSGSKTDDVTGTHIEVIDTGSTAGCRVVSVFAGSSYTSLGCSGGFNSGDNLYEQMYPVNSWGTNFVVVPLKNVNSANIRFLAAEDNTTVLVYHKTGTPTIINLNAGKFADLKDQDEAKYVLASKPITVTQYSKTQSCSGGQSDPSMTIINPIEQTLNEITLYSSRYEDIRKHYINVVIPTSAASTFRIDGNSATFTQVPRFTRYSYAQIEVSQGNHYMKASEGFIATAYGFGQYESYGYAAGASVKNLAAKITLTNSSIDGEMNLCLGQAAKFQGSAEYEVTKWEWFFGDGQKSQAQNPTHVYQDTGRYRVVMYTHKKVADGCSAFDSTIVFVKVTGVPKARYTSDLKCEKNTVTFNDASIAPGNESIFSASWRFHSGSDVFGPSAKRYYDTSGKFYLRLIVKTEANCIDTLLDSVVINPNPKAFFTVDNSCQRDSSEFNNLSTITKGKIAQHKWMFGDGDSSFRISPKHFYKTKGYYPVTLSLTSDSMCTAFYEDTAYKHGYIDLDFTVEDTCMGLDVDFTNTSKNFGATLTDFGWKVSDGDKSDFYSFTKTFNQAGKFDVMFWVAVDTFCLDSLTKSVEVYPLIDGSFTFSGACSNDTVRFVNTSTISGGTIASLVWDVNDGKSYTTDKVNVRYASPGKKNIKLDLVSDKGCKESVQKQITVRELDLNGLLFKNTCANVQQDVKVDYSIGDDTINTWSWAINSTVVSFDSVLKFKRSTPGKYPITLNISTRNQCFEEINDTITIYNDPTAAFSVSSVCRYGNLVPIDNSSAVSPDVVSKYWWYYNGAQVSTAAAPSIAANQDGSFPLRLIVESDKGCRDTLTTNVSIDPLPNASFTSSGICDGQTTTHTDNSTISTGSITSFAWTFDDMSTGSGKTVNRTYPSPATYNVKLVVLSNKGCKDSVSNTVTIYPSPVVDITPINLTGCMPFVPDFQNNSSIPNGSISQFTWYWGDGQSSVGNLPAHTYNLPGTYKVKVVAVSDQGCRDSVTVGTDVLVHSLPSVDFSFTPEKPSILESTVTFTDLSAPSVVSWSWNMGDGNTYAMQNPVHTYNDTGLYVITLTGTDGNGCSEEISKSFFISPDLFIYIPDAFSPNGDLLNDRFGVAGVKQGIRNYSISIYNRWGEKIFYSENLDEPWDGTYKGEPLPSGMYMYMIQFSDYKVTQWYYKKGELMLTK